MPRPAKRARAIVLYVRCGTVLLAMLQAYGITRGLEGIPDAVTYPPFLFRLSTVLTLTAGTLFLMWLADQITERGIGNGIALLLAAGFLAEGPRALLAGLEASRAGLLSDEQLMAMALLAVAFTALAVVVERARRRVWVRFAERQVGNRHIEEQSAALAFKLNPGGIIPAVVATWILLIVIVTAQLGGWGLGQRGEEGWLAGLAPGRPLWLVVSAVIIIAVAFVYTAFLHDPDRIARQLETQRGTIAELVPGTPPADYLDDMLSRMTALGGVYLAAIMLLPTALAAWLGLPFVAGGVSLLILVCVVLDLETQVRALLSDPHQTVGNSENASPA